MSMESNGEPVPGISNQVFNDRGRVFLSQCSNLFFTFRSRRPSLFLIVLERVISQPIVLKVVPIDLNFEMSSVTGMRTTHLNH